MRQLFSSTVLILLLFQISNAALAADTILVLQQRHRVYSRVAAYVSNTGAKVVTQNSDYSFLCTAPMWEAVIFSDKRKLISRIPMSKWSKQGIRTAISIESNDDVFHFPKIFKRQETYAGLPAQVYGYPTKKGDLSHGQYGDYWLYKGFPVHKNVELFLQALFDVPRSDGLPLRLRRLSAHSFGFGLKYNNDESVMSFLETLSSKVIAGNNVLFAAPKGTYRQVPESEIVIQTQDATSAFGDMMIDK